MNETVSKYYQTYINKGIWEQWHLKTWEDYIYPFYKEKVQSLVSEETTKNIILYGSNGMGKTMLMNLAMKDLVHKDIDVHVIDFRDLVAQFKASWYGEGILHRLMDVQYLAIDDLGKEFTMTDIGKELVTTALDYILRHRYHRGFSTWMTFNMPLADIKKYYGEHINSLLKRSSVAIKFVGEDFGDTQFEVIENNN